MAYRGLAGRTPASSYPDILQLGNDGEGLPLSGVISVCDGSGNESTLKLGQSAAVLDLNGGLLKNAIMQGCCEDCSVSNHKNGTNISIDLVASKNYVIEMQTADGSSTLCTSCCTGEVGSAGVNNVTIVFDPSLSIAESELGFIPKVGCKSSLTAVFPSGGITHNARFVFSSGDGSVIGEFDTCVNGVTTKFVVYDIYVIPLSSSYKIGIKKSSVVT